MIIRYMITCFGTTFETFTELESLQGPTTLYGRLLLNMNKLLYGISSSSLCFY